MRPVSFVRDASLRSRSIALMLVCSLGLAACNDDDAPPKADFAERLDIGLDNGRSMYMQCIGQGSPTVVFISGGATAADLWNSPLSKPHAPTVWTTIAKTNRVCAYDRPGATRVQAQGGNSRSDPVPQPVSTAVSMRDLHALLQAAGETEPFVVVAHSYGGLIARLYAATYPSQVLGMVLLDILSPEFREALQPAQWPIWITWNTTPAEVLQDYPDIERVDFDKALDDVVANRVIAPMPLSVLTSDAPFPPPTQAGIPPDFNIVAREAQDVSQRRVAQLVPGAKHITKTDSGHNVMLDNPALVSTSILEVLAAVREGRTRLLK
jgi:pimeloyl-ACP methyl ester carboxylesterase